MVPIVLSDALGSMITYEIQQATEHRRRILRLLLDFMFVETHSGQRRFRSVVHLVSRLTGGLVVGGLGDLSFSVSDPALAIEGWCFMGRSD